MILSRAPSRTLPCILNDVLSPYDSPSATTSSCFMEWTTNRSVRLGVSAQWDGTEDITGATVTVATIGTSQFRSQTKNAWSQLPSSR